MARPIKETPILIGDDAKLFLENIKNTENKKVSTDEMERMKTTYLKYKNLANFNL
jgi:hypothetical protein